MHSNESPTNETPTPVLPRAFVITHPEMGVFLGIALGLAFWSKIDPVGQTHAPTFDNEAQADEFLASWAAGRPEGVALAHVVPDANGFASIGACVAAGLPGWIDEQTPTANDIPL